ncbi:MAG: four helix bundle protein [Gemmataceae bacterium]|nr:four helix bundle protein [Planctomycetia bacterium]MBX3401272.1 four helix bundle protein [Gemmataceae bacterium]
MQNDRVVDIDHRAFQFALRIVKLCTQLIESSGVSKTIGYQLLKSGTAVGAILEEAHAAQDKPEFAHKMSHALKEARQANYWLRLLLEANVIPENRLAPLLQESTEIMKILGAITANTYRSLS